MPTIATTFTQARALLPNRLGGNWGDRFAIAAVPALIEPLLRQYQQHRSPAETFGLHSSIAQLETLLAPD